MGLYLSHKLRIQWFQPFKFSSCAPKGYGVHVPKEYGVHVPKG